MDNRTLGTFLAARRKERGLTQSQFAEQLNITQSAVSKWEQGIAIPDVTKFQEIAAILDIEVSELFMEAGEEEHAVTACTASDEMKTAAVTCAEDKGTKAATTTCEESDGARAAAATCAEDRKVMPDSAASDAPHNAAEDKSPRFHNKIYKVILASVLLCIVLAAIILFVRLSEEPVFTIVKEEYDDSGSFEHYESTYQIVVSYTGHPGREDMLEYAELIKKREHLDYVEAVVIFFCEETEGQYPMEGYREFVCYPME